MSRRNRRNRRKHHKTTDVYRMLNKNLGNNWLACGLFSVVVFIQLIYLSQKGLTALNGFVFIFSLLIFIQSIRGIVRLRMLKKKLFADADSVTIDQINGAPNIRVLFWMS